MSLSVRAALICDAVDRDGDGNIVGLRGIGSVRVATVDRPPFGVVGTLFISLALPGPIPAGRLRLVLTGPTGEIHSDSPMEYPAIVGRLWLDVDAELELSLPSAGVYWWAIYDGDELLTRVPLEIRVKGSRVN